MSRKGEASTLILMLGSAVVVACLVVASLVFFFGGSGTYRLKSLLIAPEELQNQTVQMEFVSIDPNGKGWKRYPVSLDTYTKFYQQFGALRSTPNVTDMMIEQFHLTKPSSFTLYIQEKGTFQQIDFLASGLFRLMLPPKVNGNTSEQQWIYFYHSGSFEKIEEIFAS